MIAGFNGSAAVVLKTDGTLWEWFEIGSEPEKIGTDRSWIKITAATYIAAIDSEGDLRIWGALNDQPDYDW
jgi:hypothetical protein